MDRKKQKLILSWTAVLLWMGLIFNFSSQNAEKSSAASMAVTKTIVKVINVDKDEDITDISTLKEIEHVVRKNAHFLLYLILGGLLANGFRCTPLKNRRGAYALITGVVYAAGDEFHQNFVVGRGPQISDVMIDAGGIIVGIVIFEAVLMVMNRSKNRASDI